MVYLLMIVASHILPINNKIMIPVGGTFFNHKMYAAVFVQQLANSISSFLTILNKRAMIKIMQVFLQMNSQFYQYIFCIFH